jgi:tagatose-6-phosphate ketose/aldose isomerase
LTERESRGYVHTASEIASQPAVWRKSLEFILRILPSLSAFCGKEESLILTGAGSSYYVALSVMPALRRVFPHVDAIPSTEILMDPESSFPRSAFTLVSFARSGESPEGNAVLSLADRLRPGKVRHLVITCNRDGELVRLAGGLGSRAFTLLLPDESNDKGLAMTASFTSLTIAGYSLAHLAAPEKFRRLVEGLAIAATDIFAHGSDLASALSNEDISRMFFLGTRPFFGGVMEAHLKVLELTEGRIITKADDTLGFRHGFMAGVDAGSLIILFLSSDSYRRRYEIDLLEELRAKHLGRKVLVVADRARGRGGENIGGLADHFIEHGRAAVVSDPFLAPFVAMTGQLLGLFCALRLGLRPDNPSDAGVIHRVVEGVRIHPYGTGE